jgi:hypothetical protein
MCNDMSNDCSLSESICNESRQISGGLIMLVGVNCDYVGTQGPIILPGPHMASILTRIFSLTICCRPK